MRAVEGVAEIRVGIRGMVSLRILVGAIAWMGFCWCVAAGPATSGFRCGFIPRPPIRDGQRRPRFEGRGV